MHDQPNRARAVARASHPEPVRAYGAMYAVRALELLAAEPMSAPRLARELNVGARTARRLLQRLALEGYVTRGDWHHRRYAATPRLAALGRAALDASPLVPAASPALAALASGTGAAACLWIAGLGGGAHRALTVAPGARPCPTLDARAATGVAARALAARAATAIVGLDASGCPELATPVLLHDAPVAAISIAITGPATLADTLATARTIAEVLRDGVL